MEDTTLQDQPRSVPPPPDQGPRRLMRRSEPEGKIAGVCAGIADHLGVDVTLVRIAAVVLAFSGPGLPVYLVAWAVMPKAPPGTPYDPVRRGPDLGGGTTPVAGVALLFVAALLVFDDGLFDRGVLLPSLLIGAGIWLLVRDRDDARPPGGSPPPTTWSGSPDVPYPTGSADVVAPASTWGTVGGDATGGQPPPPGVGSSPGRWPPSGPGDPPRSRSTLGQLVLGSLLLAAAGLWALTAADVVDPDVSDVLGLGVVGIGAGLLVGAWWGRARWLIAPGLVLVALLSVAGAIDVPLEGGFGERRHVPVVAGDLDEPYRLVAGEMVLDLRSLDLPVEPVTVEASIGAGSLVVLLPEDATVRLRTEVGVGDLALPGDERGVHRGGTSLDRQLTLQGDEGAGTLVVDLEVGLGEIEVTRG